MIDVVITDRDAMLVGPYPFDELRKVFSYYPPGYRWSPSYLKRHWDGRIQMLKYDKIPLGLFLAMRKEAEDAIGEQFDVTWERRGIKFHKDDEIDSERSYQLAGVRKMQAAAQKGGGLILCATGTGKTRMAGLFFKSLNGRAIFVVDELTLLEQGRAELQDTLGEEVGMVGNSEFIPQRITVATVQTLHKHIKDPKFREWYRGIEVIIVDELHVQLNRRNFDTIEKMRPLVVFGLTATLELRKKHIRMRSYAVAGPVIFEYTLEEGTREGYLTQGVVVQLQIPNIHWFDDGSQEYRDSYRELVNSHDRNSVIEKVVRAGLQADRRVVVLVEWLDHLKQISSRFRDIKHQKVFGAVKVEKRMAAKEKFDEGSINLIIANKVFQKGVNIKQVDMIVDACALKSKNSAVQKFGRGVRLAEGKKGLIYIDIGDVKNRFEAATKRRAMAFRAAGIKVFKVPVRAGLNYKKLIEQAEGIFLSHDKKPKAGVEGKQRKRARRVA